MGIYRKRKHRDPLSGPVIRAKLFLHEDDDFDDSHYKWHYEDIIIGKDKETGHIKVWTENEDNEATS